MKKIILPVISLSLILLLSNCNKNKDKDNGPAPLSTTDSKSTMKSTSDQLSSDLEAIDDLSNGDIFKAVESLNDISKSANLEALEAININSVSFGNTSVNRISSSLALRIGRAVSSTANLRNMPTNESLKGVYTYNFEDDAWDKTSASAGIKYVFPDSLGKINKENNCELYIENIEFKAFSTFANGEYYNDTVPTRLVCSASVNNKKDMVLDYSANYTTTYATNQLTPTMLKCVLTISTFSLNLEYSNVPASRLSYSESLKQNGATVLGMDATINFTDNNMQTLNNIGGNITINNLKLAMNANVKGFQEELGQQNDLDSTKLNSLVDKYASAQLFKVSNGGLIGKVKYDAKEDDVLFIKYVDGTTEPLKNYFESVFEEYKDFFEGLDLN